MNIDNLIEEGKNLKNNCLITDRGSISYLSGEEVDNWVALATRFVETNFPGDPDTIKFRELAARVSGNVEKNLNQVIAILEAFKNLPPIPIRADIFPTLKNIFENFHRFDTSIKRRHSNRSTIEINDEYDVQDAVESIIKLFVKDVRPEDYLPSYAGGNSRVDYYLPEYGIVIEIKMTNKHLSDKQIGDQLMIDFERYQQLEGYEHLICFVYDKESYIKNPHGLIKDLEKMSNRKMRVNVFISPL